MIELITIGVVIAVFWAKNSDAKQSGIGAIYPRLYFGVSDVIELKNRVLYYNGYYYDELQVYNLCYDFWKNSGSRRRTLDSWLRDKKNHITIKYVLKTKADKYNDYYAVIDMRR